METITIIYNGKEYEVAIILALDGIVSGKYSLPPKYKMLPKYFNIKRLVFDTPSGGYMQIIGLAEDGSLNKEYIIVAPARGDEESLIYQRLYSSSGALIGKKPIACFDSKILYQLERYSIKWDDYKQKRYTALLADDEKKSFTAPLANNKQKKHIA
jgi:hypothetical protein